MIALKSAFLTVFVCMLLLYLLSRISKDNSIVDVFWGIGFVIVSSVVFSQQVTFTLADVILYGCVSIWGLRLTTYIWLRRLGKPEDFRYAQWRKDWGKTEPWRSFLQIYMLQGFILLVMSIPIILAIATSTAEVTENPSWIGIFLFALGFSVEVIADYQKNRFKKKYPNGIMKTGLWKMSRHPNYFGEVILWWGIAFLSWNAGGGLTSFLSAIIITFLIRFVSGVPMLEKAKLGNEDYEKYKTETPIFVPFLK